MFLLLPITSKCVSQLFQLIFNLTFLGYRCWHLDPSPAACTATGHLAALQFGRVIILKSPGGARCSL